MGKCSEGEPQLLSGHFQLITNICMVYNVQTGISQAATICERSPNNTKR